MARRRLRVVTVMPTEERTKVRILTRNPDALRGGLDELDLEPREVFELIAQLAEAATLLVDPEQ